MEYLSPSMHSIILSPWWQRSRASYSWYLSLVLNCEDGLLFIHPTRQWQRLVRLVLPKSQLLSRINFVRKCQGVGPYDTWLTETSNDVRVQYHGNLQYHHWFFVLMVRTLGLGRCRHLRPSSPPSKKDESIDRMRFASGNDPWLVYENKQETSRIFEAGDTQGTGALIEAISVFFQGRPSSLWPSRIQRHVSDESASISRSASNTLPSPRVEDLGKDLQ